MKTVTRVVVVLLALALCLASGASPQAYKANTVKAPAGVSDEDLYTASVRVLADAGFSFRDRDKDAGIATTEWKDVKIGMGSTNYQHAWRVMVLDGEVRLSIDCQVKLDDEFSGGWEECDDKRHPDWVSKQPTLEQQILDEAKRNASKGEE